MNFSFSFIYFKLKDFYFLNSLSLLILFGEAFFSYFISFDIISFVHEYIWNSWLKSNIWASSVTVSIDYFFPCVWIILSYVLWFTVVVFVIYDDENRTFKIMWQFWKSDSSPPQGLLLFLTFTYGLFLKVSVFCWNAPSVYTSCLPFLVDPFICIMLILTFL